jgi:phosphonate transport system ATP-binding protein
MSAALRIERLSMVWPDGTRGLDAIDLYIEPGTFVAVIGLSGAGKSTLLRTINGLLKPTEGCIALGDDELTSANATELRLLRRRIGFVFQQFNLVKSHSVLRNVLNGRLGHRGWKAALLGQFEQVDHDKAMEAIGAVGLRGREESLVRAMSGGQQQRVAIARVLAQEPDLILADEPTASLDPKLTESVLGLLRRINQERTISVLLNLHEIELAKDYCDRVIALRAGRLIWDGSPAEMSAERLEEIYQLSDDELAAL